MDFCVHDLCCRGAHVRLIREGRLIAGVNFHSELPPKLKNAVLLIEDKEGSGTTCEDAESRLGMMGIMARRTKAATAVA
jgi:hypothetical protein